MSLIDYLSYLNPYRLFSQPKKQESILSPVEEKPGQQVLILNDPIFQLAAKQKELIPHKETAEAILRQHKLLGADKVRVDIVSSNLPPYDNYVINEPHLCLEGIIVEEADYLKALEEILEQSKVAIYSSILLHNSGGLVLLSSDNKPTSLKSIKEILDKSLQEYTPLTPVIKQVKDILQKHGLQHLEVSHNSEESKGPYFGLGGILKLNEPTIKSYRAAQEEIKKNIPYNFYFSETVNTEDGTVFLMSRTAPQEIEKDIEPPFIDEGSRLNYTI